MMLTINWQEVWTDYENHFHSYHLWNEDKKLIQDIVIKQIERQKENTNGTRINEQ